ncbi:3875_t:CDS:2, partial [Funneliformis mosseae]
VVEYTIVSKFISFVAENADKNWRKVASIINKDGELKMQFGLDQSLARNEAQVILNKTKLGILSDRGNSKRKAIHTGKDSTDALTSSIEKVTTTLQSPNAIMKHPKLDEKNILNEEGPINYSQKLLNEGVELETHKKAKKATRVASKTNTQKSKNASETIGTHQQNC